MQPLVTFEAKQIPFINYPFVPKSICPFRLHL